MTSSAVSSSVASGATGASSSAFLLGLPPAFGSCSTVSAGAAFLFERDRVALAGRFVDGVFEVTEVSAAVLKLLLALPRVFGGSAAGWSVIASSCGSPFSCSSGCTVVLIGLWVGPAAFFLLAPTLAEAVLTRVVSGLESTSFFARARVTRFGGDSGMSSVCFRLSGMAEERKKEHLAISLRMAINLILQRDGRY